MTSGNGATKPKRRARSAIASGRRILPTVHPQSVWARFFRDVQDSLIDHLGGSVSETQRLAVRHVAVLATEMVYIENQIGETRQRGEEPSAQTLDLYCRLGNAARRYVGEAFGWQRLPKDVTTSIDEFIDEIEREKAAARPADAMKSAAEPAEPENAAYGFPTEAAS
jgi:hypothetical protein